MTTTQVVEMSVTNNSLPKDYLHPDNHTRQTTDTPGFKSFTNILVCHSNSFPCDLINIFQVCLTGPNHITKAKSLENEGLYIHLFSLSIFSTTSSTETEAIVCSYSATKQNERMLLKHSHPMQCPLRTWLWSIHPFQSIKLS